MKINMLIEKKSKMEDVLNLIGSFGGTWLMRPSVDADINQYTINLLAIGKWK